MAAVLVFLIVAAVSVKTFSYGIWEFKRRNRAGGVFALTLATGDILLAAGYLINYRT